MEITEWSTAKTNTIIEFWTRDLSRWNQDQEEKHLHSSLYVLPHTPPELPGNDGRANSTFGRGLVNKSRTLMNGISTCSKKPPESYLWLLPLRRIQAIPGHTRPASTLTLSISASRTVRNKFLLCVNQALFILLKYLKKKKKTRPLHNWF